MKMKKKIPEFRNEKEEAAFWGKHSPIEFKEEFIESKKPFEFTLELLKKTAEKHQEKKNSVTLRMEPSQIYLAKIIAGVRGDRYQTMFRRWIRENISNELKDPRIEQEIRKQMPHLVKN